MPLQKKKQKKDENEFLEYLHPEDTEEDKVAWKGLITQHGYLEVEDTRRIVEEEMRLSSDELQIEVTRRLQQKKEEEKEKKEEKKKEEEKTLLREAMEEREKKEKGNEE